MQQIIASQRIIMSKIFKEGQGEDFCGTCLLYLIYPSTLRVTETPAGVSPKFETLESIQKLLFQTQSLAQSSPLFNG